MPPDTLESDLFDAADIAELVAEHERAQQPGGKARAQRTAHRRFMRRAKAEAHLRDLLPPTVGNGESWHVISHGDIDSLSYLAHWLEGVSHFDEVLVSTWCMARDDLERLAGWLDAGRIDQLELHVGEIFPNQYGDEWELAQQLRDTYGIALTVARNHSKVMLAGNRAADYWLVMESSANVNTNPRIEQTATHNDRELFDFYRDFYRGIVSVAR